jgi:hypothetical protein
MITSLVKTTVRYTTGGVRLVTRYGLRLTRALAGVAFQPPQRERDATPEPSEPAPAQKPPRKTPSGRGGSAKPTKSATSGDRGQEAKPTASGDRGQDAKPSTEGVPGRDATPERPADPHHALNTPVGEPDPTEWPDPYDQRPDPRDPNTGEQLPVGTVPHTPPGATSTSAPHPSQDPEAEPWEGPKRDKVDE